MRVNFRRAAVAALAIGMSLTGAAAAKADDQSLITLAGGLYDLQSHRKQEAEGRLEFRSGWGLFETDGVFRGFKPMVGIMANTAGAVFGYGGLAAPFALDRWEITPSAGMGAYHTGHGLYLGGTFEFHLGVGISYAATKNARFGVAVDHISNANTHRLNPGVNSVLFTWSYAFDGP